MIPSLSVRETKVTVPDGQIGFNSATTVSMTSGVNNPASFGDS
jgi:hypothetical protein